MLKRYHRSRAEKLEAVHYCIDEGNPVEAAALKFDAHPVTIYKWLKEYRETGDLQEPKSGGYRASGKPPMCHYSVCLEEHVAYWAETLARRNNLKTAVFLRKAITVLYKKSKSTGDEK